MRTATEEVLSVRYMLRCLGVKVTRPTTVLGDNQSVIMNATKDDSILKKKHVSISYHKTRECVAAGVTHPVKVDTKGNLSDALTKGLPKKDFQRLIGGMLR